MAHTGPTEARRPPRSRLRRALRVLLVIIIALAAGPLALVVTPMQTVTAAGQTIKVGVATPTWDLSGPGELDLFGQQIPTTVDFVGPVRPRLVLTRISLTDQLDQFVGGGLGAAEDELKQALVSGWQQYFAWQVGLTGVIAIIAFGALAGWLRRSPKGTALLVVVGLVLAEAFNLGAIMVTAYTVPSRLGPISSLEQLVGGVPPPSLPQTTSSTDAIHRVVVVGDSVASGKGNRLVPHPSADDKVCNRSRDSFAADLAASTGWKVTNLACSGATIRSGLLGPQEAAGRTLPAQLESPAVGKADLIIINVGADDVHWNVLLGLCAVSQDCANSAQRAFLQQQLSGFSRDLLQLFSQLQLLEHHPRVVVNQYYNPFPGNIDCLRSAGLTDGKRHALESDLGALNAVLTKGAEAAGFRTANPNFDGHGLCSPQPYVQGLHAKAPFHPTASGQLAIALAVEQALHLLTPPSAAPTTGAPVPSSPPTSD